MMNQCGLRVSKAGWLTGWSEGNLKIGHPTAIFVTDNTSQCEKTLRDAGQERGGATQPVGHLNWCCKMQHPNEVAGKSVLHGFSAVDSRETGVVGRSFIGARLDQPRRASCL
ncbi:hypothetical protein QC763_111885 [Podospora pseudopauciseta]|uniref:Uncharacterized protein n=1 Tax=Podospora pseudopauciseta TaxID=2093780 RepID=A0ABR0HZA1_9PEZI|nr:hypothetical protein QC763_111885 [Podospora pseudopauciseta]